MCSKIVDKQSLLFNSDVGLYQYTMIIRVGDQVQLLECEESRDSAQQTALTSDSVRRRCTSRIRGMAGSLSASTDHQHRY